MKTTREQILHLGEQLIRQKGYNAFSYQDISRPLKVKNAAIHYYFPKKSDLAIAIFSEAQQRFDAMWARNSGGKAKKKLLAFIEVYGESADQDMVCLIGAMASEFYSLEEPVRQELKLIVDDIAKKLAAILKEGRSTGEFHYEGTPQAKALMIITNLLAGLQLARISGRQTFELIKKNVISGIV
jgi:TetR/AcrR family transcriptional regulator, transcriptional repressor for nem operon